jgi:hypothetical protein
MSPSAVIASAGNVSSESGISTRYIKTPPPVDVSFVLFAAHTMTQAFALSSATKIIPGKGEQPPQQEATPVVPKPRRTTIAVTHTAMTTNAFAIEGSGGSRASPTTGFQVGSPEVFELQDRQPTASSATCAEHFGQYHMSSNVKMTGPPTHAAKPQRAVVGPCRLTS